MLRLLLLTSAIWMIPAPGAGIITGAVLSQVREPSLTPGSRPPVSRSQIKQAIAAVGLIIVRGAGEPPERTPRPRGSGVVVRPEGVVATNYHVIFDSGAGGFYADIFFTLSSESAQAVSLQNRYRLRPLLVDREQDLALLRIEADGKSSAPLIFPSIEMGDSRSLQTGDELVIIGFPEKGGLSVTVNRGQVRGKDQLRNWIRTDARVIHGNSGGAAVDPDGKLIGIPTRVVADSQPIDKNGDGFPDDYNFQSATGFLKPSHLISAMLQQLPGQSAKGMQAERTLRPKAPAISPVSVRGTVLSASNRLPVAGAMVGICPEGTLDVSVSNLLAWGGTNGEGAFVLNHPLPPGRYVLRVRAIGFKILTKEIEIKEDSPIRIELHADAGG
ncbi:MAG TPA: trypsin-like peptidase domain-containing protein [Blastocatellia bacterium]|nr:trypsin-like peptidase domain-containing protein [Blastocatellia bacterium]